MKISRALTVSAVSAVVACMITTTSFAAGVSTQTSVTQGQKPSIQRNSKDFGSRGMHGGMAKGGFKGAGSFGQHKNPMDSLVTAGTITQAQEDAIQKAMQSGMGSGKSMKDTLDSLVTAGTITQAQEDAITKAMPAMPARDGKGGFGGQHKNPMDSLVTAGTITQAQEDAIQTAMKPTKDSHKTMKETLDTLVTAGTMTQAQEDAITKAMPAMPARNGKGGFDGKRVNPMDSLVTAGTITQVQEDAIQTAMKSVRGSHETMKAAMDSLVTAGTITQAQEDAVTNMIPHAPKK